MRTIHWICQECGDKALKEKINKNKKQYIISTWHTGKCDICGKKKAVTEARDFEYPIFKVQPQKSQQATAS